MREIILTLVICLLLTVLIEESMALFLGIRKGFDLLVIFFTNTLTNPAVNLTLMLLTAFTGIPRIVSIAALELLVFFAEALIYRKLLYAEKPSPFILSLILNGCSFAIGTPLASKILEMII